MKCPWCFKNVTEWEIVESVSPQSPVELQPVTDVATPEHPKLQTELRVVIEPCGHCFIYDDFYEFHHAYEHYVQTGQNREYVDHTIEKCLEVVEQW